MRSRDGVQRASTQIRNVPLSDPVAAAKVAEQVAAFYPQGLTPCDCGFYARWTEHRADMKARLQEMGLDAAFLDDPAALQLPTLKALVQHTPTCGAGQPIPVDGAAILEKACGRYTRGAHKGQLRGWAAIEVVTEGGWKRTEGGGGFVAYPGRILSITVTDFAGREYLRVGR